MTWYVYIVSCSDQSLYTGISNNVEKRIAVHNEGKGARYTRARLPVSLMYQEAAADRSAASKREAAIKKLSATKKRALFS